MVRSYHNAGLGGVDPAPQANSTLVDPKGRTVKVWNADNPPGAINPVTGGAATASIEFKLDGFGRMRATVLKGQAQQITATYDALGGQLTLNDPDKGNWTYLNNALGQVVSQTDARANVTASTFDRLGRPLTRVTTEPASGPVETAGWFYYDSADNAGLHLVAKGAKGWTGALERDEVSTTGAPGYAAGDSLARNLRYYNDRGLPEINLSQIDGRWFGTRTDYDTYSRISQVRHHWKPAGAEQPDQQPYVWQDFGYSYAYDSRSYLLILTDSLGRPWWDNPAYDHLDRVVSVRKGSGHITTRSYRPEDGVLTAINTGSSQIQNLSFAFDGLGNLTSRTDGGLSETFGYDNLNRLTARNGATIAAYALNGNITSKVNVSGASSGAYGYDPAKPHAVTSAWGYAIGYDANGNVGSRTKTGESWAFRYAGFDKPRWMAKTVGSVTAGSEFLYNANRSRTIHLEFDSMSAGVPSHYARKRVYGFGPTLEVNYTNSVASGTGQSWSLDKVRIYVPGPDGTIGAREFDVSIGSAGTEKTLVYHHDHLGSIHAITPYGDTSSALAADDTGKSGKFSEDPWGQRRNPSTWTGAPTSTDDGGADSLTPRGFTGHEMLDDLGLVHMNGRIYDPLLGRFLSADTFVDGPGDLQGYNRYSYVKNRPLSATDPSGHLAFAIPLLIGGGSIAISGTDLAIVAGIGVAIGLSTDKGQQALGQLRYQLFNRGYESSLSNAAPVTGSDGGRIDNTQKNDTTVQSDPLPTSTASPIATLPVENEGFTQAAADAVQEGVTRADPALVPTTIADPIPESEPVVQLDMGRAKNHLKPEPTAEGAHTTFKTNASGQVTGYAEWTPNAQNPSGFDEVKRVDTQHAPPTSHVNKATGQDVPVPHVHDPSEPGGVRPARPEELPN